MEFAINETDLYRMACAREDLLGGSLDAKRPAAWRAYGYPETVSFSRLMSAYERGGPAHSAVHYLLDGCWQMLPRIRQAGDDAPTPWEAGVSAVLDGCEAWAKLRDLDRRQMIGRYGAVVLRVRDGKALREPLERAGALVDLVPLYEDQLRVVGWVTDQARDDYGQPAMWQAQTRRPGADDQGMPIEWIDVHPSRIIIMAEGAVGHDFFAGVPLLRSGYNALVDLEKISGGSAEGFLKASSRTLVFRYDKDTALQALGADGKPVDIKQLHEDRARALNSNIDSAAVVKGGSVDALQVSVPNPKSPFEVAGHMFCAAVRLSFSGVFGQRLGTLAGDQDQKADIARFKGRQANELTPMVKRVIRRLQECGIIEQAEFEVSWPDISAPSDLQKLERAWKMAEISQKVASTPGAIENPFDANEIRQAAGYEPRTELPVGEGG